MATAGHTRRQSVRHGIMPNSSETGSFMLWLKAFHVIAVVTWFAGLFYLPRLYVYHADADDSISLDRFRLMQLRLFAIMTIAAVATVGLAAAIVAPAPVYLSLRWSRIKLLL